MSNKRKILNFGTSQTSEAARRQLMQPVACWERVWVTPEHTAPGANLKVPKWVRTEKQQVRALSPRLPRACRRTYADAAGH